MARKRSRKKKKLSIPRQQYLKERKRLSSMVSRLRKKGYKISLRDVVGEIPKRITKKQVRLLQELRSQEQLLALIKKKPIGGTPIKPKPIPGVPKEPTWEDVIYFNFLGQLDQYHPDVQSAIRKWLDYIIENFGMSELASALDTAEYENIYLSAYGGYIVNPEDLALYLHQLSHFVMGDDSTPDLEEITNEVEQIIFQYSQEVEEAELAEFGSWYAKNNNRKPIWAVGHG